MIRTRSLAHCARACVSWLAVAGAALSTSSAHAQTTALATAAASTPAQMVFGSLMTDRVEARVAPGFDQQIVVLFQRAGLPVQLLDAKQGWFKVQDWEGTAGWVRADLISRRRTAIALDANRANANDKIPLRASEGRTSNALALLESGLIVGIISCDGTVCNVTASGMRGFVDERQLWGTAAREIFK